MDDFSLYIKPKERNSYINFFSSKLNTYLKQVPMWTGLVQSLLSFGLSELPERGNRNKKNKLKSPGNQLTGGREEREFSKKLLLMKHYSGKTLGNCNEEKL